MVGVSAEGVVAHRHAHTYICTRTHAHTHKYICTHIHNAHTHTHTGTYTCAGTYIHTYIENDGVLAVLLIDQLLRVHQLLILVAVSG